MYIPFFALLNILSHLQAEKGIEGAPEGPEKKLRPGEAMTIDKAGHWGVSADTAPFFIHRGHARHPYQKLGSGEGHHPHESMGFGGIMCIFLMKA